MDKIKARYWDLRYWLADLFDWLADLLDDERAYSRKRDQEALKVLTGIARGAIPANQAQGRAYAVLY